MANSISEYLTGKCLVSMPSVDDDNFERSVVYICSHSENGAMGFVLNKKLNEFTFADLAEQLPIPKATAANNMSVHSGGPLEKVRGFVIHSTDYVKEDTVLIDENVAVSSSIDILSDIAFGLGPKNNIITLGYSSWAPKQLEQEIIDNHWLVMPANPDLIFQIKEEDMWQKAIQDLGINLTHLSPKIGHA